ncbi:MAG TPA: alpha/beta fold hydrolase [Acidimicrobiia bacterium]|jgi:alpha-beta hydrolase superfamily lysophospholipase
MPTTVFDDELLQAQFQRALMAETAEGNDHGEFTEVSSRIGTAGLDRWHDEWRAAGVRATSDAEHALVDGSRDRARSAFMRAATAFRTAAVMLLGAPVDERVVAANLDQTDAFRRGAELLPTLAEVVAIPYESTTLPGYWFAPAEHRPTPGPVVVLTGGYDGTAEELYAFTGAAAVARGYRVLAFDGPGQGAALLQQGLVVRPDWEAVVGPVLDWVCARPDVDAQHVALIGLSLGAHLAPRAASAEHRLAACAADCGAYDLRASAIERIPGPLVAGLDPANRVRAWLLTRILDVLARKPTAGWALRRGQLVHGASSPIEYLRSLAPYTLEGHAEHIACPMFVNNAEDDDIGASAPQLVAALTVPHEFATFTRAEGAGDHCEVGNRAVYLDKLFAWLDPIMQ